MRSTVSIRPFALTLTLALATTVLSSFTVADEAPQWVDLFNGRDPRHAAENSWALSFSLNW